MVSKELFIILLFNISINSASEHRSGFRSRKENNHHDSGNWGIESEDKSSTRQEKRKD